MARVAWSARLRPDRIDEYIAIHDDIWPDMLDMIKKAGVRNYSIYLHGTQVFGYYECDDPDTTKALQERAEVARRWGAVMAPLFEDDVATAGPAYLREVFRVE